MAWLSEGFHRTASILVLANISTGKVKMEILSSEFLLPVMLESRCWILAL